MTSFPSIKTDLRNAGANWVDQEVVTDRGWSRAANPTMIGMAEIRLRKLKKVRLYDLFQEALHDIEQQPRDIIGHQPFKKSI